MPQSHLVVALSELEAGKIRRHGFVEGHSALVRGHPRGEHTDALRDGVDVFAHIGGPPVLGGVGRHAHMQAVGAESRGLHLFDDAVSDGLRAGHALEVIARL